MNPREKVSVAINEYEAAKINVKMVAQESAELIKRANLAIEVSYKRVDMATHELIRVIKAVGKNRAVAGDKEYHIMNGGQDIEVTKSDLIVV